MDIIKIAIIEDDEEWLQIIKKMLNNDFMVVATGTTKDDAINIAKTGDIDCYLLDINLQGNKADGIEAAHEIIQMKKDAKIIMLTALTDPKTITDSFAAGAIHYVFKDNLESVPGLIKETCKAEKSLPIEILLKDYQRLKTKETIEALSEAEKQVLSLVKEGLSVSEIAQKLYKSENTIKTQIKALRKKLNIRDKGHTKKNINWLKNPEN